MPPSLKFLSWSKIVKTSSLEFALDIDLINDLVVSENLLFWIFLEFLNKINKVIIYKKKDKFTIPFIMNKTRF